MAHHIAIVKDLISKLEKWSFKILHPPFNIIPPFRIRWDWRFKGKPNHIRPKGEQNHVAPHMVTRKQPVLNSFVFFIANRTNFNDITKFRRDNFFLNISIQPRS